MLGGMKMKCPNCEKFMDGLSMSGDETETHHEFYCNNCHTYLTYQYNPMVTNRIIQEAKNEKI
jgi:transposase-like protein